jgi:hypothetical protein
MTQLSAGDDASIVLQTSNKVALGLFCIIFLPKDILFYGSIEPAIAFPQSIIF